MKRFTTTLTMAVMAITMTAVLCGCPQSGNLACWLWSTDAETGVQTATPVGNFSGIDAPVGAYFHFDGGKVDTSKSWVDYQVVGRDEPVRLNLVKSEDGGEKCLSCTSAALIGLTVIAGHTVPAIVDAVANAREQWFDVVVPMGPVVETATLNVTTTVGDQFVLVLYGEADGYQPPTENSFRLTVKVQGQGSVAIDGVDQEVTTSAVFDVEAGSDVYFTAQPASGWRLEKWMTTGDGGETWSDDWTAVEAMITMNSDVEVVAIFVAESAPVDTTAPVITIKGENPVNLLVGATWTDPGASAIDAMDGECNVSTSGSVNTGAAGTYTITYSATDRSGNQSSATRTVVVRNADVPNPGTTPKMTYTLLSNGSLQQAFSQDGCTLQQCWLGFPSDKTWADVDVMGTMFMEGSNPLLYVASATNSQTTVVLNNAAFAPGRTFRAVPVIKMKGESSWLYGNTGIVFGYNAAGTRLTRSDGDNYDLTL